MLPVNVEVSGHGELIVDPDLDVDGRQIEALIGDEQREGWIRWPRQVLGLRARTGIVAGAAHEQAECEECLHDSLFSKDRTLRNRPEPRPSLSEI
jgi:hypothetical protein